MSIDLCVVSYNSRPYLDRLIRTLISDRTPDVWDLYIQDNASSDDSRKYLENPDLEDIATKIVLSDENTGYAYACNNLASMGSGEIIALLNADVWFSTSDVFAISQSFKDNSEIAILGPKQRNEVGKITHAGIGGTNEAPKHRGWLQRDPLDVEYRDLTPMVTVSGSAYFVRRSVWEALATDPEYKSFIDQAVSDGRIPEERTKPLGAFLPTKHYYEETFLSYFARHRGYGVWYDGRISIGHTWHGSHKKGSQADKDWPEAQALFRSACDYLGITHD